MGDLEREWWEWSTGLLLELWFSQGLGFQKQCESVHFFNKHFLTTCSL